MYPILRADASLGAYIDINDNPTKYFVENVDGELFEINDECYKALEESDGKTFRLFSKENKDCIDNLIKNRAVQKSRLIFDGFSNISFALFQVSNRLNNSKKLLGVIDVILNYLSITTFITGVTLFFVLKPRIAMHCEYSLLTSLAIIIASSFIHELGHTISGIANGYKIRDISIDIPFVSQFDIYTETYNENKPTKKEKLSYYFGGMKANLLVAGLALIVSLVARESLLFIYIFIINMLLVIDNIIPYSNLTDGSMILNTVLGVENISDIAFKELKYFKNWPKFFISGSAGFLTFMMYLYIALSVVIFYLLISLYAFLAFAFI